MGLGIGEWILLIVLASGEVAPVATDVEECIAAASWINAGGAFTVTTEDGREVSAIAAFCAAPASTSTDAASAGE